MVGRSREKSQGDKERDRKRTSRDRERRKIQHGEMYGGKEGEIEVEKEIDEAERVRGR